MNRDILLHHPHHTQQRGWDNSIGQQFEKYMAEAASRLDKVISWIQRMQMKAANESVIIEAIKMNPNDLEKANDTVLTYRSKLISFNNSMIKYVEIDTMPRNNFR
jgi:hypothetical protein